MMNDSGILKRITKMKIFPYLLLAIVAGVILLILPADQQSTKASADTKSIDQYTMALEDELEELIKQIDGVGSCRVMVYTNSSFSYLYASDQELEQDGDRRKVSKKVVFSSVDGNQQPIIIEEYLPKLSGVAVVVDSKNEGVLLMIKNMLSVLLDIDESRIFITR